MSDIPQNIPLDTHARQKTISDSDRQIIRRLAARVAELAARDIEHEKALLWTQHNDLQHVRPLVVCSPENAWNEIITADDLKCSGDIARGWEWALRQETFWGESLCDDRVIKPYFDVGYVFSRSNWGLSERYTKTEDLGSYVWDAPVKKMDDIDKLRFMTIEVDYPATEHLTELADRTLGDLLPIRRRTMWVWSVGLTWEMAKLRGLEQVMYDMHENPEIIHRLMAFLRDGTMAILDFLEDEGLLTPNNADDYVGSGGFGWTKQLPAEGFDGRVRLQDLWGLAEAQEFTVVSPAMYEEFVFPYQLPLLERFGLACYGCCEPVHDRWHIIRRFPNLRRVSVSPWCNREKMVECLGDRYVYSLKPNPSALAQNRFDADAIRADIADTLDKAKGCHVEIIMKDTHTIGRDPSRAINWMRIVREEIDKRY